MISSSMYNGFVYGLFYDLYVYFSCEFFCKLGEMWIKRIWLICLCFSKSTWHYWSYWYNILRKYFNHSTHLTKHNNTKTSWNLLKLREKTSQKNLVTFTTDQNWMLSEKWNFKGEVSCLPLSWYHYSSLPPLKRHFQKYLLLWYHNK